MDGDLEKSPSTYHEKSKQIETPDGKSIYVFRYDNPLAPNRNPNSNVSKDEIVGKWFTDSLKQLKSYILMRPPGGSIVIAQVPKDRLENLKAANQEIAKDMDIEPIDNYLLTDELLNQARIVPFDVKGSGNNKFLFTDRTNIDDFVDGLIPKLQAPEA